MKKSLIDNIEHRIKSEIDSRSSLAYLKKIPVDTYYDTLISTLYVFTRPRKGGKTAAVMFAEVIAGVGNRIRGRLGLRQDTTVAARTGAFMLWTFEDMGMLQVVLTRGKSGHNQYHVMLRDDEPLSILWRNLPDESVDRLPPQEPWPDWKSTRNSNGARLIKTANRQVHEWLTPENCPLIYNMVNRAQKVGWRINDAILPVYDWCMKHKAAAFMDIWEAQNKDARATKLREVKTIADMARRLKGRVFYHGYYLDFRYRKYPATAYLHEQGSDFARGLLYRNERKHMRAEGFQWLLIYLASLWAGDAGRPDGLKTDKIPILDRIEWAVANEGTLLSYATSPTENQGWMNADAPWQFLAGCMELRNLREWQIAQGDLNNFDYLTGYEAYLDGYTAVLKLCELGGRLEQVIPTQVKSGLTTILKRSTAKRLEAHNT